MRLKLFLLLFVAVLLVGVASAEVQETSYTFKQNDFVNYNWTCLDDDGIHCSSGTPVTLTLTNPRGVTIFSNSSMTFNPTSFNHTIDTSTIGEYKVLIIVPTITNTTTGFSYLVTASGEAKGILGFYILMFVLIYLLTFFSAYWENVTLTTLGAFGMIILGMFSLINGIDIYRNNLTEAFSLITIFIGAYFAVTGSIKVIQENL
jgi:hypothetical protein|tara:strand:- start:3820 stop:4431 length:612 start_codon:yes stop_codon:yes gene_type:complete